MDFADGTDGKKRGRFIFIRLLWLGAFPDGAPGWGGGDKSEHAKKSRTGSSTDFANWGGLNQELG